MEIALIDGSIKSFIVDDSQTVRKISDKLGEHLDLGKDAEQFCLCWPGSTVKKRKFLFWVLNLSQFFSCSILFDFFLILFSIVVGGKSYPSWTAPTWRRKA